MTDQPLRWGYVRPGGRVVHAHAAMTGGNWPNTVCRRLQMMRNEDLSDNTWGLGATTLRPCADCVKALRGRVNWFAGWITGS